MDFRFFFSLCCLIIMFIFLKFIRCIKIKNRTDIIFASHLDKKNANLARLLRDSRARHETRLSIFHCETRRDFSKSYLAGLVDITIHYDDVK